MRLSLITACILFSTSAFADTNTNNGIDNTINNHSNNGSNNSTSAVAGAYGFGGSAKQHQSQSVKNANSYSNKTAASTAYAAPLTAAEDACMGSSSAGGQGMGFGLSVGSTWQDTDCVRRKDSRELYNMGKKAAALALMCQNESVYNAMDAAGTPCPETVKPVAAKSSDTVYEYPN